MILVKHSLISLLTLLSLTGQIIASELVTIPKGKWSGTWYNPGSSSGGGKLEVKIGFFSKIQFKDAHKSCLKPVKLPVKKNNGAYQLENPFRIDIGGQCGPTKVDISIDQNSSDKYHFVFTRDKYMLQPFEGDIVVNTN